MTMNKLNELLTTAADLLENTDESLFCDIGIMIYILQGDLNADDDRRSYGNKQKTHIYTMSRGASYRTFMQF
jgi:hypothetical protein